MTDSNNTLLFYSFASCWSQQYSVLDQFQKLLLSSSSASSNKKFTEQAVWSNLARFADNCRHSNSSLLSLSSLSETSSSSDLKKNNNNFVLAKISNQTGTEATVVFDYKNANNNKISGNVVLLSEDSSGSSSSSSEKRNYPIVLYSNSSTSSTTTNAKNTTSTTSVENNSFESLEKQNFYFGDIVAGILEENDSQNNNNNNIILRVYGVVCPSSSSEKEAEELEKENEESQNDNTSKTTIFSLSTLSSFASLVPGLPLATNLSLKESGSWSRIRMLTTATTTNSSSVLHLLSQLCSSSTSSSSEVNLASTSSSSSSFSSLITKFKANPSLFMEHQSNHVSHFLNHNHNKNNNKHFSENNNEENLKQQQNLLLLCKNIFADPLTDAFAERSGCTITWWKHKLLFASSPFFVTFVISTFLQGLENNNNNTNDTTTTTEFFTEIILGLVANIGKHLERISLLYLDGADISLLSSLMPLCEEAAQALASVAVILQAWKEHASMSSSSATSSNNNNEPFFELPEHIEGKGKLKEQRWIKESATDVFLLSSSIMSGGSSSSSSSSVASSTKTRICVVDAILRGTQQVLFVVDKAMILFQQNNNNLMTSMSNRQQISSFSSSSHSSSTSAAAAPLIISNLLPTISDNELGGNRTASIIFSQTKDLMISRLNSLCQEECTNFSQQQQQKEENVTTTTNLSTNLLSPLSTRQRTSRIFGCLAAGHLLEFASSLIYEKSMLQVVGDDNDNNATMNNNKNKKSNHLQQKVSQNLPLVQQQRFGILFSPQAIGHWVENSIESATHTRISSKLSCEGSSVNEIDSRLVLSGFAPKWLFSSSSSRENNSKKKTTTSQQQQHHHSELISSSCLGLLTVCAGPQHVWLIWFTVADVISLEEEKNNNNNSENGKEDSSSSSSSSLVPAAITINLIHHDASLVQALLNAAEMTREDLLLQQQQENSNSTNNNNIFDINNNAGSSCVFFRPDASDSMVDWCTAAATQFSLNHSITSSNVFANIISGSNNTNNKMKKQQQQQFTQQLHLLSPMTKEAQDFSENLKNEEAKKSETGFEVEEDVNNNNNNNSNNNTTTNNIMHSSLSQALRKFEDSSSFSLTPTQKDFIEQIVIGESSNSSTNNNDNDGENNNKQQEKTNAFANSNNNNSKENIFDKNKSSSNATVVAGHGTTRTGRTTCLLQAAVARSYVVKKVQENRNDTSSKKCQNSASASAASTTVTPTQAELRNCVFNSISQNSFLEKTTNNNNNIIQEAISSRSLFLLRLLAIQQDFEEENSPTMIISRRADSQTHSEEICRLQNALSGKSLSNKQNLDSSSSSQQNSLSSFLSQANSRCIRAPFVSSLLQQSSHTTQQLEQISDILASSEGILSDERILQFLTTNQSKAFLSFVNTTATKSSNTNIGKKSSSLLSPEIIKSLTKMREQDEIDTETFDLMFSQDESIQNVVKKINNTTKSIGEAEEAKTSITNNNNNNNNKKLKILPLPNVRNVSSECGISSSSSSLTSESAKKLSTSIALLARSDFSSKQISSQQADSIVSALRYRSLTSLHKTRQTLFQKLCEICICIRDFVESTAVASIRSLSGSSSSSSTLQSSKILVVDETELHKYSSLLSRIPFHCILIDDCEALSPFTSYSLILRPMQTAWSFSLWKQQQQQFLLELQQAQQEQASKLAYAAMFDASSTTSSSSSSSPQQQSSSSSSSSSLKNFIDKIPQQENLCSLCHANSGTKNSIFGVIWDGVQSVATSLAFLLQQQQKQTSSSGNTITNNVDITLVFPPSSLQNLVNASITHNNNNVTMKSKSASSAEMDATSKKSLALAKLFSSSDSALNQNQNSISSSAATLNSSNTISMLLNILLRKNRSRNSCLCKSNITHIVLSDEGISQDHMDSVLFSFRKSLVSQIMLNQQQNQQQDQNLQQIQQQQQHVSSSSFFNVTSMLARSLVRTVSLWSLPKIPPITNANSNTSSNAKLLLLQQQQQAQQQQDASSHSPVEEDDIIAQLQQQKIKQELICANIEKDLFLQGIKNSLKQISELAAPVFSSSCDSCNTTADSSSSSKNVEISPQFIVAFVSEKGNLLSFGDDDDNIFSSSSSSNEKNNYQICSDLSSVPSSIDSLVLIIVPSQILQTINRQKNFSINQNNNNGDDEFPEQQQQQNISSSSSSLLRSVTDAAAASKLLLRVSSSVICVSTNHFFTEAHQVHILKKETASSSNISAVTTNIINQQQQKNRTSASSSSCYWISPLLRIATQCRNNFNTASTDADILYGGNLHDVPTSSPALEICCPRHRQQSRGFLLFVKNRQGIKTCQENEYSGNSIITEGEENNNNNNNNSSFVQIERLLPSKGISSSSSADDSATTATSSSSSSSSGLFGTCRFSCLAKYQNCNVRSHLCLQNCHSKQPEEKETEKEQHDKKKQIISYETSHQQQCPYLCNRKLPCSHICQNDCGDPCQCTITEPCVILERTCGEECITGVNQETKEPTTDFYKHRIIIPCNGVNNDNIDESSSSLLKNLPPCQETVEIICGRCSSPIQCCCFEAKSLHWVENANDLDDNNSSNISGYRCPACRGEGGSLPPTGEVLEQLKLRNKLLAKRAAFVAAQSNAREGSSSGVSSERVAAVLKRYSELESQQKEVLKRAEERIMERKMADVKKAKHASSTQENVLADVAAHRVQFFSVIKEQIDY